MYVVMLLHTLLQECAPTSNFRAPKHQVLVIATLDAHILAFHDSIVTASSAISAEVRIAFTIRCKTRASSCLALAYLAVAAWKAPFAAHIAATKFLAEVCCPVADAVIRAAGAFMIAWPILR